MGGFHDRMIGLVKRSLRKAIEKLCLTEDHLVTVLKGTEATINSRPLVYGGDDINSGTPLTPAHFLSLSKQWCKGQESIQSSTTPDPGYKWESNKLTVRHHKREPVGQPFPVR